MSSVSRRNLKQNAALRAALEMLEPRHLLSVNLHTLFGPEFRTGSVFSYEELDSHSVPTGANSTSHVIGPTTFQGKAAIEVDTTGIDVVTGNDGNPVSAAYSDTVFFAITNAGLVTYGSTGTEGGLGGTTVLSPYELEFPAGSVQPGQTITSNTTITSTDTLDDGTVSSSTIMYVVQRTLVPGTFSITVPAGTFECLKIDQVTTATDLSDNISSTSEEYDFYSAKVGVVESVDDPNGDPNYTVLTSSNVAGETLAFDAQPGNGQTGNILKPPIVVDIKNANGTIDSSGPDANDSITLTLNGNGSLTGTTTVAAVHGVATFANVSVSSAGNYTLTASADVPATSATSTAFTISNGPPSPVTTTLPRLNVPIAPVSGADIKGSATLSLTNNTQQTVSGTQTVTAYLDTTTGITGNSIQIGTPQTSKVTIKVGGKPATINFKIKSLPQVPAAGDYFILFKITDSGTGASTVIASPNTIHVTPAAVALVPTITAIKFPPSVVSGGKTSGSVTLSVANSGNTDSTGTTAITISATTDPAVDGTPIATFSSKAGIKTTKPAKITVPIKSLPVLAGGTYFLVATVVSPFDEAITTATSATSLTIAAPSFRRALTLRPFAQVKASHHG